MAILHDAYRIVGSQNIAYAASGGASAASARLGPETYWVLLTVPGIYAAGSGVRIAIGDAPAFTILSGSYNSTTGLVTLTLSSPHGLSPGATGIVVSGATGTGANLASVNGTFTAGAGTTPAGSILTYTIAASLTITSITGGTVATGTDPVASGTSTLIAVNYPYIFACNPGQKVAVVGNDTVTGSLNVTELA